MGIDLSKAQLESNLEAQRQMRELAEREARNVKTLLVQIVLQFLAPELDKMKVEEHQNPTEWLTRDLGPWVIEKLNAKFNRLRYAARGSLEEELQEALAENERLRAENRELSPLRDRLAAVEAELEETQTTLKARDTELSALHREATRLREEVAQTREAAAPAPAPPSPLPADEADSEAREPEWLAEWRTSRGFESDQAVVRVMGFQGFCLRQSVESALAEEEAAAATVWRSLGRLQKRGLVEQSIPETEIKGKAAYFYWLTDTGREAFRALFGEEAAESEYQRLKARHKGDEHIILNLQARDVFEARGFTVNLYPERSVIQGEFYHDPDLVVIPPDQARPLYVECERATASTTRGRDAKWGNYAKVTSDFCFVVPNKTVQSRILSEVTRWAFPAGASITIRICNLSDLPPERASPWTLERPIRGRQR